MLDTPKDTASLHHTAVPETQEIPPTEDAIFSADALSNKRKSALLRYMAILFGVAFLLVLLSFLIQARDSQETISDLNLANVSALQKAGNLQEKNQMLTTQNLELSDQLAAAQAEAAEAAEATAQLQTQVDTMKQEATAQLDRLEEADAALDNTTKAYDLLISAMAAYHLEDTETLTKTLDELTPLSGSLSESAKSQYQILLGSLTTEN